MYYAGRLQYFVNEALTDGRVMRCWCWWWGLGWCVCLGGGGMKMFFASSVLISV